MDDGGLLHYGQCILTPNTECALIQRFYEAEDLSRALSQPGGLRSASFMSAGHHVQWCLGERTLHLRAISIVHGRHAIRNRAHAITTVHHHAGAWL